ncbi:MAG: histidinol-phosphate transaminase [Opitutales bacterium]
MSAAERQPPRPLLHVERLHAYVPGEQPQDAGWIKLNTNECPYPPSPRVPEAFLAELQAQGDALRLYPEPVARRLREAIAQSHGLLEECVLAGNGSDDVLNLLIRTYCDAVHPVGYTVPSYSLYPVLAGIQNCPVREIAFERPMALNEAAILNSGANVFFLTSPNAPTGVAFSNAQIARIAERFEGLLVVDEAYVAYAESSAVELLKDYPNLAVTRTFSKSHSLAGLRVGYLLAHREVIQAVDKVRDSYNLDRLTQAGALAALGDADYTRGRVAEVIATRERIFRWLESLGWFTYPSQANFVFTEPKLPGGECGEPVASALFEFLKARKILVRRFPNNPLTAPFLRISIGTDSQMDALMEAVEQWLKTQQVGTGATPA